MASPPRQQPPFPDSDSTMDQFLNPYPWDQSFPFDWDPWAGIQYKTEAQNDLHSATYQSTYCTPSALASVTPGYNGNEIDWTTTTSDYRHGYDLNALDALDASDDLAPMPLPIPSSHLSTIYEQSSLNHFGSFTTAAVQHFMRWQGTDVDVLENPAVRTDDPLHYPDLTLPILDDDSVDTTGKSWPEPMKGESSFTCCDSKQELEKHAQESGQDAFPYSHLGHGRIESKSENQCDECKLKFPWKSTLGEHAKDERHEAYMCKCNKTFTRSTDLQRHVDRFSPNMPKYPCPHCKRHRGLEGFRRKDHLTQHLQKYHHHDLNIGQGWRYKIKTCSHPECDEYRGPDFHLLNRSGELQQRPFAKQADYIRHMRGVHDESPFPCGVPQCLRIRGKGYFRESDLVLHHRKVHPEAPPYSTLERNLFYPCQEPNCDANRKEFFGSRDDLIWHYQLKHKYGITEAVHKAFEPMSTAGPQSQDTEN